MGAPVRGYLAPAIFPSMTATPTATPSPVPTPTPQPAPLPVVTVAAAGVQVALTDLEFDALLSQTAWPRGLWAQVKTVAWCESGWRPWAEGDHGNSRGLMQLNAIWFAYGGEDAAQWADPLVNLRAAWAAYQYDIGRGYEPWTQWGCSP